MHSAASKQPRIGSGILPVGRFRLRASFPMRENSFPLLSCHDTVLWDEKQLISRGQPGSLDVFAPEALPLCRRLREGPPSLSCSDTPERGNERALVCSPPPNFRIFMTASNLHAFFEKKKPKAGLWGVSITAPLLLQQCMEPWALFRDAVQRAKLRECKTSGAVFFSSSSSPPLPSKISGPNRDL